VTLFIRRVNYAQASQSCSVLTRCHKTLIVCQRETIRDLAGPAELRLAHLFEALLVPNERLFAMLSVYCDAAGKEQQALVAVGGMVSTAEQWRVFDCDWRRVLREFGLEYFRMSEFAHSIGQFRTGWKNKESKRRALLDQLITVIADNVRFWTGVCVLISDFDKVDADYELHERMYPYTLCAKGCVHQAITWYNAHHREDGIEFVFEDGDEHFPQMRQEIVKETGIIPIERKKRDATPCQAADFAAYEVLKAYRLLRIDTQKLFERYRTSFARLNALASRWGQYGEKEIRVLCRALERFTIRLAYEEDS
jgi:hypothetical protein